MSLHRALIVEDDLEAANDLVEVLQTCGCESTLVTNRRDALEQVDQTTFCIVLLDLQIKSQPDSIRGRVDHGRQLLKELRHRYPQPYGLKHLFPIVVLSGYAAEAEAAVSLMKDGASDVLQKLSTGEQKADRIQEALEDSGRMSHSVCVGAGLEAAHLLSVPGDQQAQRVLVRFGQETATVTHSALKVLLHLIKARLSNRMVHKSDLGATAENGFRGISNLRNELGLKGDRKELITNDGRGNYGLAEKVTIGQVATEKLVKLGDRKIAELAEEIRLIRDAAAKAADNK